MADSIDPAAPIPDSATSDAQPGPPPLYATFPRRLNALSLDSLILVGISAVIILLLSLVEQLVVARISLVVLWWVILLFYEPLMVWRFGGTLGHLRLNLRVADNRTDDNISLAQALIRFWVKVLLGVFSFLSMNFSRRHQAVHDIVTNSSVRIRNATRAKPYHYIVGRT